MKVSSMLLVIASVATIISVATAATPYTPMAMPDKMVLSAPFTAFHDDATQSINLDAIAGLADHHVKFGANAVWAVGGMGQWPLVTIDERKLIFAEWAKQGHSRGIYMIAHVGVESNQSAAIELARHAYEHGADAIAAVPAFGLKPKTWDDIIEFFKPVVAAAPGIPFLYYHIPATTGIDFPVYDFLVKANQTFPELAGIKYVSENWWDWLKCVNTFDNQYRLLWAAEPKLRALALSRTKGAILAESFYASTWLRMVREFNNKRLVGASQEQAWKEKVEDVFGKYRDGKRAVFRALAGVEMGPARGSTIFDNSTYGALISDLTSVGFFSQELAPTNVDEPSDSKVLVLGLAIGLGVSALGLLIALCCLWSARSDRDAAYLRLNGGSDPMRQYGSA